jgi:hypothetical protein
LKALCASALFGVSATALIGFAHTPAGKPVLHWLAAQAGCPASFANADPVRVEAYRVKQLRAHAGTQRAQAAPALGFELGVTSRAQVDTWVSANALQCESQRQGSVLQCQNIEQGAAAPIANLHLQFDQASKLVAVDVQRAEVCGSSAVAHLRQLQARLERSVGPATSHRGRLDASYLDGQRFANSATEFRYQDYLAKLSASHLHAAGITVREQYQWVGGQQTEPPS